MCDRLWQVKSQSSSCHIACYSVTSRMHNACSTRKYFRRSARTLPDLSLYTELWLSSVSTVKPRDFGPKTSSKFWRAFRVCVYTTGSLMCDHKCIFSHWYVYERRQQRQANWEKPIVESSSFGGMPCCNDAGIFFNNLRGRKPRLLNYIMGSRFWDNCTTTTTSKAKQ